MRFSRYVMAEIDEWMEFYDAEKIFTEMILEKFLILVGDWLILENENSSYKIFLNIKFYNRI